MRIPVFLLFALSPGVAFAADDAVVRPTGATAEALDAKGGCGAPRVRSGPGRTSEDLAFDVVAEEHVLTPTPNDPSDSVPSIALNVVLTNRSRVTRDLVFGDSCLFDYLVRGPDGEVVLTEDLSFGCFGAATSLRLRPGERTVQRTRWTGRVAHRQPLPPGRYAISALLHQRSCGGELLPRDESRAVTVEILPVAVTDERSPDEAIRRFAIADPPVIPEQAATAWQGQPTWDAADSRTQRALQQTAGDLASARAAVASSGVRVLGARATPAAYVIEGVQESYPVIRAVWRDDFYRPTRTFQPAYWPHHAVLRPPASFAAIAPVETGELVSTPSRETARPLAALLWAQDYKEGPGPARLLSERATENDTEVRVARFTVARDVGPTWGVRVWEWVLVADKRTKRVTRGATLAREIPPPCPPVGPPQAGRTAEGLRLEVAIEPRVVAPVVPSVPTLRPAADATITVTLSNPMSEDVYLTFADARLRYRVSRADGQPADTIYDAVLSFGMSSSMRVRAGQSEEQRFQWVGRLDESRALPPGRYRVQALVGSRSCGPHSLREELSEPAELEVLAAVGQP